MRPNEAVHVTLTPLVFLRPRVSCQISSFIHIHFHQAHQGQNGGVLRRHSPQGQNLVGATKKLNDQVNIFKLQFLKIKITQKNPRWAQCQKFKYRQDQTLYYHNPQNCATTLMFGKTLTIKNTERHVWRKAHGPFCLRLQYGLAWPWGSRGKWSLWLHCLEMWCFGQSRKSFWQVWSP